MTAPTPGVPGHDITPIPAPQGHPSPTWWLCSCGKRMSDEEIRDRHLAEAREFAAWAASLRDLTLPQLLDEYGTALHRHTTHGRNGTYRDKMHGREQSAALRAEIDRRLPAAPSGETAPNLCGHTIAGILGRVLMCTRPAGHDGAHGDPSGAQWGEVPAGEEMAAASVPAAPETCGHCGQPATGYATAHGMRLCHPDQGMDCYRLVTVYKHLTPCHECRTDAQATPTDPPLVAMPRLDDLIEAIGDPRLFVAREDGEWIVRWKARAVAQLLSAAPSGEQPTPPDDQVDAIRREVYDNVYVNDDDGYPWLTCGLCGKPLKMVVAGDEWSELDAKVAGHDCARPAGEQPTAEPAGEV